MKAKMTFVDKEQEWQTLLDHARQKLSTMTRTQLKRFLNSRGPGKVSAAEPPVANATRE